MPIIRIEMLEGRSVEKKRELAAVFTHELARIAGCTEESVYVVFEDVKKENWGVAGKLLSDR